MLPPLYLIENVTPAYQLRWSLALFAKSPIPPVITWQERLKVALEPDGIRLLDVRFDSPNKLYFLISTRPQVSPTKIVKLVKGRLQHCVQSDAPKAFRRNFALTSLGSASREVVESYVDTQLDHHLSADPRVDELLADFQLAFADVNLAEPILSSHGLYLCNLQLVLVNESRDRNAQRTALETTRDTFLRVAAEKCHRLSRLSLLADHLHATLGFGYLESPAEIALNYMNDIAVAHGMKSILQPSYYVGTFGEYDMQAVRHHL